MPIEDRFPTVQPGVEQPATRAVAVTPNNDTDLTFRTRALVCTGGGSVNVHMAGSSTPVLLGIAAGVPLAVRVDRVLSTSTTATGIVALD